jgi:hypothetical protein
VARSPRTRTRSSRRSRGRSCRRCARSRDARLTNLAVCGLVVKPGPTRPPEAASTAIPTGAVFELPATCCPGCRRPGPRMFGPGP